MSEVDPNQPPTAPSAPSAPPVAAPAGPPWEQIELPDTVFELPAMLSREERRYLAWLTATQYQGMGAIVDLGCWFGGSSCAMAEGLKSAGRTERIHSFDLFEWTPDYMEKDAPLGQPAGWDFLPEFERRTSAWREWIAPRKVDLTQFIWTGGPIEILFVDAAKSWQLINSILAGFGPALIPGKSRVVFQDFRLHHCYWLLPIVESRPDVWREAESVEDGTTVTFVPLRDFDGPGGLPTRYHPESFRFPGVEHLVRRRMARENAANRNHLLRVLLFWARLDGTPAEQERVAAELFADTGRPMSNDERKLFHDPGAVCVEAAWTAVNAGEYAAADRFVMRTLSVAPAHLDALLLKILIERNLHGLEAIADLLVRAEEIAPLDPRVVLWRLTLRASRRQLHGVADQLLAMLQFGLPDTMQAWAIDLLCNVLQPAKDVAAAVALLRSLLPRYAGLALLHARIAQGLATLGDRDAARSSIADAIKLEPGNAMALEIEAELDRRPH